MTLNTTLVVGQVIGSSPDDSTLITYVQHGFINGDEM